MAYCGYEAHFVYKRRQRKQTGFASEGYRTGRGQCRRSEGLEPSWDKAIHKGRYEEALTAYNLAISLKGDDPEAWNNKGAALAKLGFYEDALAAHNKALTFRLNFPKAWNNKGLALSKLERFEESLKAYEVVISLRPDDAEAWKNKTVALARLSRFFEALDAIQEALSIQPDFEEALELKGRIEKKVSAKLTP